MVSAAVSAFFVALGVKKAVGFGAAGCSCVAVVGLECACVWVGACGVVVPVECAVAVHGAGAPPAECAVDVVV